MKGDLEDIGRNKLTSEMEETKNNVIIKNDQMHHLANGSSMRPLLVPASDLKIHPDDHIEAGTVERTFERRGVL